MSQCAALWQKPTTDAIEHFWAKTLNFEYYDSDGDGDFMPDPQKEE